jgi:hypothetical protein
VKLPAVNRPCPEEIPAIGMMVVVIQVGQHNGMHSNRKRYFAQGVFSCDDVELADWRKSPACDCLATPSAG